MEEKSPERSEGRPVFAWEEERRRVEAVAVRETMVLAADVEPPR
jgi:hypothetical protein